MTSSNVPTLPPAASPTGAAPAAPFQTATLSAGYLVTVGGLLLLIIGVLAALWMRERNRRVAAERDVSQLLEQSDRDRKMMAQMMMGSIGRQIGPEAEGRAFQRQDHKPVSVTLDGAKRQAYILPASGARRFGFQAGDVIVVEEDSPATTSSAPSTSSAREP